MSREALVPGGAYVNETGTRDAQTPGGPYVNETVAGFIAAWIVALTNVVVQSGAKVS